MLVYSGFQCIPLKLDAVEIHLFLAVAIVFGCQITAQMQELPLPSFREKTMPLPYFREETRLQEACVA
jgi:hypothetical protein